jgi:hypothetical protein
MNEFYQKYVTIATIEHDELGEIQTIRDNYTEKLHRMRTVILLIK